MHNKELLVRDVISQYFVQSKYESFTRQLNGWGFKRLHQSGNGECASRGCSSGFVRFGAETTATPAMLISPCRRLFLAAPKTTTRTTTSASCGGCPSWWC